MSHLTKISTLALIASLSATAGLADHFTPEAIQKLVDRYGGIEGYQLDIANKTNRIYPSPIGDDLMGIEVTADGASLLYKTRLIDDGKEALSLEELRDLLAKANAPATCDNPAAAVLIVEYNASYQFDVYSTSEEYLFSYTYDRQTCPVYLAD
jgi:hypothetical protein